MAWDYAANCRAIMDRSGRNRPWSEIIAFGLRYLDEQRAYLRNLLEHTSGHESFFGYMPSVNTDARRRNIQTVRRHGPTGRFAGIH